MPLGHRFCTTCQICKKIRGNFPASQKTILGLDNNSAFIRPLSTFFSRFWMAGNIFRLIYGLAEFTRKVKIVFYIDYKII